MMNAMPPLRYIFFDVGNTLLFPNRDRILAPLPSDRRPTLAQWQAVERKTKIVFDEAMRHDHIDYSFWAAFHTQLLKEHGFPADDQLIEALALNTRHSANWNQILPGTIEALKRIGSAYKISVISNSDGKIDAVLRLCGIADCFLSITDSGIVGREKPDRLIFETALRTMKADAAESLYVGDVYSIDYVGARNAGMQAVLFDVAGTYRDRDLPRVESLVELESWLKKS
jgi:HAD superfamily hydrolase (TIGR01549 family)